MYMCSVPIGHLFLEPHVVVITDFLENVLSRLEHLKTRFLAIFVSKMAQAQ